MLNVCERGQIYKLTDAYSSKHCIYMNLIDDGFPYSYPMSNEKKKIFSFIQQIIFPKLQRILYGIQNIPAIYYKYF